MSLCGCEVVRQLDSFVSSPVRVALWCVRHGAKGSATVSFRLSLLLQVVDHSLLCGFQTVVDTLFHVDHSLLCGFQTVVDTASESSVSALSDATSTSIWEVISGELLACRSEVESAELSTGPCKRT